jgi:hypothetical protein
MFGYTEAASTPQGPNHGMEEGRYEGEEEE